MASGYTLQYQVWQDHGQQMLSIWEPIASTDASQEAFLYQMNYRIDSEQSACALLNHVLKAAGAEKVTPYQFQKLRGKIKVMPNPTLKLMRQSAPASQVRRP
ncbi:MAG: hypothetical protein ACO4AI_01910 [Prochlorothrix sp.]|nr:hypothetical protein [Prochlorothrix sp.]